MASAGFLQGLVGQFGKLFTASRSSKEGRGKSSRASENTSTIDTAEDSYRFEQKVRKLLTRSAGKKGGSLHYIGIAKVRAFYGPRWAEMAERVHGVVQEAVKRRLGEQDLYAQHRDDGYIIVFADTVKEAAKLKCGLMAQEMSKRLFGSDDCEHLDIATIDIDKAGRITAAAVQMGQVSDRIASQQRASGQATEVGTPGRPAGGPPAAVSTRRDARPATARPVVGSRPAAERGAPHAPVPSRPTGTGPTTTTTSGSGKQASPTTPSGANPASVPPPSPAVPGGTAAVASTAPPSPPPAVEPPVDRRLRFVYRPLWYVRRKVIMGFVCVPCRVTAENVVLFGGAAMPASMASAENAAFDRLTLTRVVRDLKDLIGLGQKSVLVAPIHHLTIANPNGRELFAQLFADTSEELRNLVVFELMGVPEDLGKKDLTGMMEGLKPYGKAVLVRRRLESLPRPELREVGIYGVGVEIGNYAAPEREIIPAMNRFGEAADRAGLASYIHGLRSVSLTSAAIGAGLHYIDGDLISTFDEAPQSVFPFDLVNLYEKVRLGPTRPEPRRL